MYSLRVYGKYERSPWSDDIANGESERKSERTCERRNGFDLLKKINADVCIQYVQGKE